MFMLHIRIALTLTVVASPSLLHAQPRDLAKNDFEKYCAECHGLDGKGHGPRATQQLERPPADLTKLSEKNGGLFPIKQVYNAIDGRVEVWVYGHRDMPPWGDIYTRELRARMPRDYPQEAIDALVRDRILTMVEYLSSLQGK